MTSRVITFLMRVLTNVCIPPHRQKRRWRVVTLLMVSDFWVNSITWIVNMI